MSLLVLINIDTRIHLDVLEVAPTEKEDTQAKGRPCRNRRRCLRRRRINRTWASLYSVSNQNYTMQATCLGGTGMEHNTYKKEGVSCIPIVWYSPPAWATTHGTRGS